MEKVPGYGSLSNTKSFSSDSIGSIDSVINDDDHPPALNSHGAFEIIHDESPMKWPVSGKDRTITIESVWVSYCESEVILGL